MSEFPGGVHPFAAAFPMITGVDFAELVDDIEKNGLREKIIVSADGVLIDGRNRWAALEAIGWEDYPSVTDTLPPDTPEAAILELIVSKNLARRHLNPGQKAMLAVDLEARFAAITKPGRRTSDSNYPQLKVEDRHERTSAARAAKVTGASASSVEKAKRITKQSPAMAKKVRSGEISLHRAKEELDRETPPEVKPQSAKKRNPQRKMEDSVNSALSTLNGLCLALSGIDEIDTDIPVEQRAAWLKDVTRHIQTLSAFRRLLKEED